MFATFVEICVVLKLEVVLPSNSSKNLMTVKSFRISIYMNMTKSNINVLKINMIY